jgi:hypothetical protein
MELMDWKNIELSAENQIKTGEAQIIIGNILLAESIKEIKKLGGKTNAEINAEEKAKRKATNKTTK